MIALFMQPEPPDISFLEVIPNHTMYAWYAWYDYCKSMSSVFFSFLIKKNSLKSHRILWLCWIFEHSVKSLLPYKIFIKVTCNITGISI